jgi:rare lipoprotein A
VGKHVDGIQTSAYFARVCIVIPPLFAAAESARLGSPPVPPGALLPGKDGDLHEHRRAAGKVIAGLVCAALVVVSLAALRNSKTPDDSVELMTSSRVDFSTRLASAHASRGEKRVYLAPATTTSTTEAPPPTTAKPRVIVRKTTTTTAKPKPKAQSAQPKPAPAASNTPTTVSSRPMPSGGSSANHEEGKASWYEAKYHANNPWICAHKTIPMGTVLTVTAVSTGKSITCEVGDRGPYADGRILDLSKYAFSQLANPSAGVIYVKIAY